MSRWLAVVALLVVTAGPEASGPRLYLRGLGALRIDMSLQAVRAAIGDRRAALEGLEPDSTDDCSYLRSRTVPRGVGLMFMHGQLVRIDVREGSIRTASGIGIGSSEDDVKRVYGSRITSQPHKYITGHYLIYTTVDAKDKGLGMRFETDGRVVINYRTGHVDAVEMVEGCA